MQAAIHCASLSSETIDRFGTCLPGTWAAGGVVVGVQARVGHG